MSKCDLRIEFERPDRLYYAGDTLRGVVHVGVDDECKCNALVLEIGYYTHGRGNGYEESRGETVLFSGLWSPHSSQSYPFEFLLPHGPFSYRGTYLNVDWYVHVRADVPWALDPKLDEDFVVMPHDRLESIDYAPTRTELSVPQPDSLTKGESGTLVFGLSFAGFGGIFVAIGVVVMLQGSWDIFPMAFVGMIFVLIGLAIAGGVVRRMLAERKTGPIEVVITPQMASPGQHVVCALRFQPRSPVDLLGATATLSGEEVVVYGSGTDRTTYREGLHNREHVLAQPGQLPRGQHLELAVSIPIPDEAPLSFDVTDNAISWKVAFHLDIDNWPDWKLEVPIAIVPRMGQLSYDQPRALPPSEPEVVW